MDYFEGVRKGDYKEDLSTKRLPFDSTSLRVLFPCFYVSETISLLIHDKEIEDSL